MDSTVLPETSSEPASVPLRTEALKPFELQTVTITRREHIELRQKASSYRNLHARAIKRIQAMQRQHTLEMDAAKQRQTQLEAQLTKAQAQIRDLRQRVFGVKTEQSGARSLNAVPGVTQPTTQRRSRGQQPGQRGHGRTRLPTLPAREQHQFLDQGYCPACGQAFEEIAGTQDAQVLEIEVKAYRRVIRRHRYRRVCHCTDTPGMVMPAPAAQLIARGKLGISIWVEALLSKYLYGQPTHRLLQDWADHGLHVAQSTLTEGLHRLEPMLAPLAAASLQELRNATHWHADETRWEVFQTHEGKIGHRWYLWVFQSNTVVSFVLDPSRSAQVPMTALKGVQAGILSVDRYAAYRKFARCTSDVQLAICWAHQRRDFLCVANDYPALWDWAMGWVVQIGRLYALHAQRRAHAQDVASPGFIDNDTQLRALLGQMQAQCRTQLADAQLATAAARVLRTLQQYWAGLVVFVDHPCIDLDKAMVSYCTSF